MTVILEMIGGGGRMEEHSASGSRGAVVCGFGRSSPKHAASVEEASVDAGGGMSCFRESEGDNADAIEHGGVDAHPDGHQEAVIEDRTESAHVGSAQSTGKVDP